MRETDHRHLTAALAQRKHAESALWALVGLPRMEPVEFYLSVLTDVYHVAHNGVFRPDVGVSPSESGRQRHIVVDQRDLVPKMRAQNFGKHFQSRPPAHDPRAQRMLREMLKDTDKMASRYLSGLDEIVGEAAA